MMKKFTRHSYFYKGYYYYDFGAGFTVDYMGDELYFDTVDELEAFIDSLEEE